MSLRDDELRREFDGRLRELENRLTGLRSALEREQVYQGEKLEAMKITLAKHETILYGCEREEGLLEFRRNLDKRLRTIRMLVIAALTGLVTVMTARWGEALMTWFGIR